MSSQEDNNAKRSEESLDDLAVTDLEAEQTKAGSIAGKSEFIEFTIKKQTD